MNPSPEFLQALQLDQIAPSPFNPRTTYSPEELAGLAASIMQQGLLQPIVVRTVTDETTRRVADEGKAYQLVAGHRRVMAALQAGLDQLPAIVRSMTDAEVRSAHLVENLQRENLKALEEAEGYGKMRDVDGLSAAAIAERVGKKPGVVHNRLKLLELCEQARNALVDGRLGAEVAQLIARIPIAKLQARAVTMATETDYNGEVASYRKIRDRLVDEFTLNLSEAIFPRDDGELLPAAGACTNCPKRSGGDPDLFSDIIKPNGLHYYGKKGEQICTDPDCFAAKKAAHLKRQAEKLEAKGITVVAGNAAKRAVAVDRYSGKNELQIKGEDFVPVDQVKVDKKADVKPVVIQDPRTGKTVKAYKRDDLAAAGVKAPAVKKEPKRDRYDPAKADAERNARAAAAEQEEKRRRALLAAVRAHLEGKAPTAFELQLVAHVALAGVMYDDRPLLAQLWGLRDAGGLDKRVDELAVEELTRFVIDCGLVGNVACDGWNVEHDKPERLLAAAKHYGIEVPKAEKPETPAAAPARKGAKK